MRTANYRFWPKVRSASCDECWPWTAGLTADGYGRIRVDGHNVLAHRLAWELTNGPIPPGLWVLHNCPSGDNPACCNPGHLWLGTHADNMRDMVAKGRQRCQLGEQHWCAKLTAVQVHEIRQHLAAGETQSAIARVFGVSQTAIFNIDRGRTWSHLEQKAS